MKILRILALAVLICGAIYLVALYFAHPQCKFDGNPFDCDDDVFHGGTWVPPETD